MPVLVIFVCVVVGFYIIAAILELINISLFDLLLEYLIHPLFDFFHFYVEKSTLRIVGKIALLLVVTGFFMPIGCNQNGFQIAEYAATEYAANIDKTIGTALDETIDAAVLDETIDAAVDTTSGIGTALDETIDAAVLDETIDAAVDMTSGIGTALDETIDAAVDTKSGIGTALYVLFFVSLIGGLLIIPLVMKKKMHIVFDWVSIIAPIVCVVVLLSNVKGITGVNLHAFLKDLKLQIGGNIIIIGLIVSLLAIIFASGVPEKEKTAS